MKRSTRQDKQLERVEEWLHKARKDLEVEYVNGKAEGVFQLLIAVELITKYLRIERFLKESQ